MDRPAQLRSRPGTPAYFPPLTASPLLTEHIRWLEEDRMLITDVNGTRFEIKNFSSLDKKSQTHIHLLF